MVAPARPAPAFSLPRPAARLLAVLPVLLFMGPLLPGLVLALAPALEAGVWRALASDPQWPAALRATVISSTLGTVWASGLAAALAMALYPGARWLALQRQLPLLLALPHAAFAIGLMFLLAPSGWLARLLAPLLQWATPPDWVTVQDPLGLSLSVALALKETAFLLWVVAAVLSEPALARQALAARSLGYGHRQVWRRVLWPQLLPRLAWPLVAVWAYGLSVVDMALVLGPTNPPTLAVLSWRWLSDPDPEQQALGMAAAVVLLGLLLLGAGAVWGVRRVWRGLAPYPDGLRRVSRPRWGRTGFALAVAPAYAVLAVLCLWSLADGWFFPALWPQALNLDTWRAADVAPLLTTLALATGSALLGLVAVLLWLEWGPQKLNTLLYLPLVLPALPLAAGQYSALLGAGLDGSALGVLWSHLMWVLPYMLLVLVGPYRALDPRLALAARCLGQSRWRVCWRVKWPLLLRPVLAALAVGFAVSVAQYLPTLFAGAGRWTTVTTEAVALSAGGDRRVLAVQALLQALLPLLAFGLAVALSLAAGRHRRVWSERA